MVLIGKYTSLQDSYMSVVKALEHASMRCGHKLDLQVGSTASLQRNVSDGIVGRFFGSRNRNVYTRPCAIPQCLESSMFRQVSFYGTSHKSVADSRGIVVPGGFGLRGTEGMISAAKWAREQKVPYLGICLGFQIAVIEWARNVCGLEGMLASCISL